MKKIKVITSILLVALIAVGWGIKIKSITNNTSIYNESIKMEIIFWKTNYTRKQ